MMASRPARFVRVTLIVALIAYLGLTRAYGALYHPAIAFVSALAGLVLGLSLVPTDRDPSAVHRAGRAAIVGLMGLWLYMDFFLPTIRRDGDIKSAVLLERATCSDAQSRRDQDASQLRPK